MPWPNSQIELLATTDTIGTSITANWTATTAGRLLLGFYGNAVTGDPSPPWTPTGWTYVANFGSHYIIGKVSDGTETTVTITELDGGPGHETSLDILGIEAQDSLSGFANMVDTTSVQTTTGGSPATLDDGIPAGTVNLRLDYGIGHFGANPAPGIDAPAVFIVGHNGRAFQRANSVHGTEVDPPITGGGTFAGGTITDAAFGLSIFLRLVAPCTPVQPSELHVSFKDRLHTLRRDFTEAGISRAQSEQFDNWKMVERWASDWMILATDADRCRLFVPFKDHSRHLPAVSAAQSFDNWKAVERWAHEIAVGGCGCGCPDPTPPPDRCRLFVPFKNAWAGVDVLDPDAFRILADQEFANFKALEIWANRYARGECVCIA